MDLWRKRSLGMSKSPRNEQSLIHFLSLKGEGVKKKISGKTPPFPPFDQPRDFPQRRKIHQPEQTERVSMPEGAEKNTPSFPPFRKGKEGDRKKEEFFRREEFYPSLFWP